MSKHANALIFREHARIQEFSSGGPTFGKILTSKKAKKKNKQTNKQRGGGEREGGVLSLPQKYGFNRLSRHLFTYKLFWFKQNLFGNCNQITLQQDM